MNSQIIRLVLPERRIGGTFSKWNAFLSSLGNHPIKLLLLLSTNGDFFFQVVPRLVEIVGIERASAKP